MKKRKYYLFYSSFESMGGGYIISVPVKVAKMVSFEGVEEVKKFIIDFGLKDDFVLVRGEELDVSVENVVNVLFDESN